MNLLETKKKIVDDIAVEFKSSHYIIIRSSSLSEDTTLQSLAGAFESILNVNPKDLNLIEDSINKVIDSLDNNPKNQILIQEMINDVDISGVVMTKVHDDGSPYYVINFDDKSGKTDTVTSGNSINKTVYVYNGYRDEDFENKSLLMIMKVVKKIESNFKEIPLDIEFTKTNKGEVFVLQARPITTIKNWDLKSNQLVKNRLPFLEKFIEYLLKPKKGVFGRKSLFGIMPDWNPVELIGLTPNPLSLSLYRKLITEKSWRISREMMGYLKLPNIELMVSFFGRPYINVRNSFNSFLPNSLNSEICEKLINEYISKLHKNPHLHDKVEFEVVFTCYEFDIKNKFTNRYPGVLNDNELIEYCNKLKEITKRSINNEIDNTLDYSIKLIDKLKFLQKNFNEASIDIYEISEQISFLVDECIQYGTIPFAISARHGFISETLMKSLEELKLISKKRLNEFKKSIKTISSELSNDFYRVSIGELSKSDFLLNYGHLRPNSYDVLSPSYLNRPEIFNGIPKKSKPITDFRLTKLELKNISDVLKDHDFNIEANVLFSYFKKSIIQREYQKFIFTKHLSKILNLITHLGEKIGLNVNEISFLTIDDILNISKNPQNQETKSFFQHKIQNSKVEMKVSKSIKLNYLIRSKKDIYIAPLQRSSPNFIGSGRIEKDILFLNSHISSHQNFDDKIICIEGADPGYDWIFSRNIAGLITKFGGVNSHMSIRCSENGIPAAIGCGEQPFNKIIESKRVQLDCNSQKLEPI